MNKVDVKEIFSYQLLFWFKKNKVRLPWRETSDPYKIFISEFLLRKTTRQQLIKIYPKFFDEFPDIKKIYDAPTKLIEETIHPLGLGRIRSHALKEISGIVMENYSGRIPNNEEQLIALPHVGRYIANAVLCFAFGEDLPILDSNILRIIRRVFSIKTDIKRGYNDPKIWGYVSTLIPKNNCQDFNKALLDFGSLVCSVKPKCNICPVLTICDYYKTTNG